MTEQRKLIRLGNSSFAIALPKGWIDKSGLKKGDKIFIEPNSNNELIITSDFKEDKGRRIEISLEGKDREFIKENLQASYIKGYHQISFKGDVKSCKKEIADFSKKYLSLEIIDANDREIILRDFFDIKETKFENFVRRIDNNLRELFDIVLEQIQKSKLDESSLKEADEIDEAVNKFYFLCSRIFMQGINNPAVLSILKMNSNKLFNNWWVSFHLEGLGDGLKHILKSAHKLSLEDKNTIQGLLTELHKDYLTCMESFYKANYQGSADVISRTKKLLQEVDKLEKKDPKNLKTTHSLELIRKNIYQIAKMIFYMEI